MHYSMWNELNSKASLFLLYSHQAKSTMAVKKVILHSKKESLVFRTLSASPTQSSFLFCINVTRLDL